MRISRLVIESDRRNFTLDLHPRCTVIAGLDPAENDALISEFTSAIGPGRAGVHLELTDGDANKLAVFRPATSRHRVIDVTRSADLTEHYRKRDGSVDLLHANGTSTHEAREHLVLSPSHLPHSDTTDPVIRKLASLDQKVLHGALKKLETAEKRLAKFTEADPDDSRSEAVDRVEALHAELEERQATHERGRRFSYYVGVFAAVVSFLVVLGGGPVLAAVPLVGLAAAMSTLSIVQWRRLEEARVQEDEALDEAGAQSYLGLHIQRVNSLITNNERRSEMLVADEQYRLALDEWKRLAGDIPMRWVLEHSYEIAQAGMLRQELIEQGALAVEDGVVDDSGLLFLRSLRSWITTADGLGKRSGLPIICNDPFQELDSPAKPVLLEELTRTSLRHQVVFLTQDPDVISWAAAEAVAGHISLLEQARRPEEQEQTEEQPERERSRVRRVLHRGRAAAG
jgi:hypothetical protein